MHERLDHFAEIYYGKSPAAVVHVDGIVPVFGTGGVYAHAIKPLFTGPAIVVPRKGSLGSPHLALGAFWASDTTFAVIPKRSVDAHWLYCQLLLFDLERLNEATGVPSISRDWLSKIPIFSHAPDEQSRISSIIRQIEDGICQAELGLQKLRMLKQAAMQSLLNGRVDAVAEITAE